MRDEATKMSDPRVPDNPFDAPSGDLFADVPLLREIQRVLLSSDGPVNWELARQIGIASAQWGQDDEPPTDEDARHVQEAVRLAELQIGQFTGLAPPTDVASVRAVRRAEWVQANIESLRDLLEPAAERVGEAITKAQQEAASSLDSDVHATDEPGIAGMAAQLQQAMGQLSPLLLGAQVGQVLGYLGQRVLGQYDIAVPRSGPGSMLFVIPNISAFERDWSLPETDFRTWVALHEVAHRFEFAQAWTHAHFRTLLDDFLSTLEFDVGGIQERLAGLDISDPEAMQRAMESEQGLFGTVLDAEQRIKLARIQAFMAAAEGYGDHLTRALGERLLPSYGRIGEAMRRYRESEQADPVFERLLGIEMKRDQYRLGLAFCDAVAELTDEATLSSMWSSPEALPSMPEIEEPRLWLARSA
jgi:putative hydrolase